MALFIYNGQIDPSELGISSVSAQMIEMMEAVMMGNTIEMQEENVANRFLNSIITEMPSVNGTQVPIERFNLYFTPGGLTSDSAEFNSRRAHFDIKKEDFKVTAYKFPVKTILEARNTGGMGNLMDEAVKKTQAGQNVYMNIYLPSIKLQTLITGDSSSTSCPTISSAGAYESQLGALRGENVDEILPSWITTKTRNHFFTKLASTLSTADIQRVSQSLKDYRTYSKRGVVAMASANTLFELTDVYGYAGTKDEIADLAIPVTKIAGVGMIELESMPDGFLCFIDAGAKDVIVNAVENDIQQRGLGMITTNKVTEFESPDDIDGMELQVWAEGFHLVGREKVAWLAIGDGAEHASGIMQATQITALENHASALREGWIVE